VGTDRAERPTPPAVVTAALVTLVVLPFPVVLASTHDLAGLTDIQARFVPADVAAAALLVTGTAVLRRLVRGPGRWAVRVYGLAVVLLGVSAALHPGVRAAHTVLELAAGVVLAAVVAESVGTPWGRLLAATAGGVAAVETAWSTYQTATGHRLGLLALGEQPGPFNAVGGSLAPLGSMTHAYLLAGFGAVAAGLLLLQARHEARPRPWVLAAALAIAPVGYTYSRSAALGVVIALGVLGVGLVWSARRRAADPGPGGPATWVRLPLAAPLLAVALGAGGPALLAVHGWWARADQTATARTADQLTTERAHLVHEALGLLDAHPLVGVGPGGYIPALARHYRQEPDAVLNRLTPVHNVPLLAATEGGLAVGVAMVGVLAVAGWRAARSGPLALAVYLLFLPWWLLDHFPWTATQGVFMAALWLGVLDGVADRRFDDVQASTITHTSGPQARTAR